MLKIKEATMRLSYHDEKEGIYVNGVATDEVIILRIRQLKEVTEVRKGSRTCGIFATGKVVGIVIDATANGVRCMATKPSDFKLRVVFDHDRKAG